MFNDLVPTIRRAFAFRGIPFAAQVDEADHSSWYTFTDEQVVRDTLFEIQAGDLLFDVGCGFGSYAFSALAIGAAHAHCWSINAPHIELMKLTAAVNGWEGKVTLNGTGLYKESGWLVESSQAFTQAAVPGQECFQVETLDDYIARLPREMKLPPFEYQVAARKKTWLKIDTEGAELEILQGAKQFIQDYRPTILLENHDFKRPGAAQGVLAWLTTSTEEGGPGYEHIKTVPHYSVSHSVYRPLGP